MRQVALVDNAGFFKTSWGETSNFRWEEFKCKGGECSFSFVAQSLIDGLQHLRNMGELPIKVHSGIRCPPYNIRVGGAKNSQHLPDGDGVSGAADIAFYQAGIGKPPISTVRTYLMSLAIDKFRGRGLGATYVHLDVRAGEPAEWTYGDPRTPTKLIEDLVKGQL